MDRLLVTGGAGFVGSHVAEQFASQGIKVIALDNLSRAQTLPSADRRLSTIRYNWRYLEGVSGVELVRGDVRKAELVSRLAKGVDAIIHTAAQVAVTSSLTDPLLDFEVNAVGTLNVLEAARKSKRRPAVVYASTNKVYGDNVNRIPVRKRKTRYEFADERYRRGIPEAFPIDLCEHTPYGCSKLAGDLYCQDYGRRGEVRTGIFRMSCIYGTRQFGNEDQGWVAHFLLSGLRRGKVTIFGDGLQVRDLLWAPELVEAYERFLEHPEVRGGEVFNIGGGPQHTSSLNELMAWQGERGVRPEAASADWRAGDQKVYISDVRKASKLLGWRPRTAPTAGFAQYVRWAESDAMA